MKILLVSIACPPKKDPECLQVGKYLKYLIRNGLKVDVLTSSSPTLFMPEDSSLNMYLEGVENVSKLRVWENKYINFVVRRTFLKKFQFPDSKFLFHIQKKKALKLIDPNVNLIYSRSYPLSSALLANKLKKEIKKPWVMHLSDPWYLSPLHKYTEKEDESHACVELECIKNADAITFTSIKTLNLYKSYYPQYKEKFYFFPNVYDPDDKEPLAVQFNQKLRIVHTGGLIGSRNPSQFIKALAKLFSDTPFLADSLEVVFAGETDRQTKAIFDNCSLPFVKYVGPLSYRDSIKLQRSAHILLLIDNDFQDEKMGVFFPSKLLDYFLTERRVFAITSPNSETSNALEKYLSCCFSHVEVDRMGQEVLRALCNFKRKNSNYFVADAVPEIYNVERQSAQLKKLFETICAKYQ